MSPANDGHWARLRRPEAPAHQVLHSPLSCWRISGGRISCSVQKKSMPTIVWATHSTPSVLSYFFICINPAAASIGPFSHEEGEADPS